MLTIKRLFVQVQVRLRIILQHIFSHAQILGNVCADNAAAFGAYGFTSNQNMHTGWVQSSLDSITLSAACGNLDDML